MSYMWWLHLNVNTFSILADRYLQPMMMWIPIIFQLRPLLSSLDRGVLHFFSRLALFGDCLLLVCNICIFRTDNLNPNLCAKVLWSQSSFFPERFRHGYVCFVNCTSPQVVRQIGLNFWFWRLLAGQAEESETCGVWGRDYTHPALEQPQISSQKG